MEYHRLSTSDHTNSSTTDQPPITNPSWHVVDDQIMVDLVEVGYSMNAIREGMNEIHPNKEFNVVKLLVQQPRVS